MRVIPGTAHLATAITAAGLLQLMLMLPPVDAGPFDRGPTTDKRCLEERRSGLSWEVDCALTDPQSGEAKPRGGVIRVTFHLNPVQIVAAAAQAAAAPGKHATTAAACALPAFFNDHKAPMHYFSGLVINGMSYSGWASTDARQVYNWPCRVAPRARPELYDCSCG